MILQEKLHDLGTAGVYFCFQFITTEVTTADTLAHDSLTVLNIIIAIITIYKLLKPKSKKNGN